MRIFNWVLLGIFCLPALNALAQSDAWWQQSQARAMLPPVPHTPKSSQRLYLKPVDETSSRDVQLVAVEATTSAVGTPQAWVSMTSHMKIANALMQMAEHPESADSLAILQSKRGKILFKNLAEIAPQYANFDALAWLDKQNNWMLFINEKHETAPIPALVALISHEAMHSDAHNSRIEEAEAWTREARVWVHFRKQIPNIADLSHPLVHRLNHIADLMKAEELQHMVMNHPSYKALPMTSPYFSQLNVPMKSEVLASVSPQLKPIPVPESMPLPETKAPLTTPLAESSKNRSDSKLRRGKPTPPTLESTSIATTQKLVGIRLNPLPYGNTAFSLMNTPLRSE
jgi:hypothetical protein